MIKYLFKIAVLFCATQTFAETTFPFARAEGEISHPLKGSQTVDTPGFAAALRRQQSRAVEFLSREFSRAAAQGLIEASEFPSSSFGSGVQTHSLEDRSNLSIVTGIDRDIFVRTTVPPTETGAVCLSNQDVDLNSWGDTSDTMQLGKLRADSIAENGEITSSGATKLARFYIAMGFGAEAAALSGFIHAQSKREIIQAMADIIDHGTSESAAFDGQIFCKGAVSLWAALASPIERQGIPESTDDILSTFSSLPIHLRSHLGPLLTKRLQKAGLEEAARTALNAVTRGGAKTEEGVLMTARLGLNGTQSDVSRAALIELTSGTDVTAAEALLELLEDAERRNVPPDASWVDDVPSLVRATEGTNVSARLNLAGYRGMIKLKRFDAVRLAIREDGEGLTDATRSSLAANALSAAAKYASEDVFLRSELGFSKLMKKEALSRSAKLSIAARLSYLGISERALTYLPQDPDTLEERRTASDILSATGQNPAAVALLEEKPHELATTLGTLLAEEGMTERALTTFSDGGEVGSATLLAIRNGNWEWVAKNGTDSASEATQALLTPIIAPLSEPSNGALLLQSEDRRMQAERMLELLNSVELRETFTN